MTLVAQHKYGIRVSKETKWKEFIAHLGESAVTFELLQAKPSSAVKINFESSLTGSSRGKHRFPFYFWMPKCGLQVLCSFVFNGFPPSGEGQF